MILITSAAYVEGELVSEVGLIPPSFLPIGNKRLYELQVALVESQFPGEDIFLSIPASFEISNYDRDILEKEQVTLLQVPEGLSLGNSILFCWNASAAFFQQLRVLHGDTLFLNCTLGKNDSVSLHANKGVYRRATANASDNKTLSIVEDNWSGDSDIVLSGYFSFEEPLRLMKYLVESGGNFTKSISAYSESCKLSKVTDGIWLDFGHVNSFYSSRTKITTQRAFNELNISERFVEKHSKTNNRKILAEGKWFESLPMALRLHTPHLLELIEDINEARYKLEYLYLLPLSDLYVFSKLPVKQWKSVFEAINSALEDFSNHSSSNSDIDLEQFDSLYSPKTMERLEQFYKQRGNEFKSKTFFISELEKSFTLEQLATDTAKYISKTQKSDIAISHGDFCFSNILYDSRVGCIKCIDPRGMLPNGEMSVYGDKRYDLAKLYHSVIGLYDFIIAGQFTIESSSEIDFPVLGEIDPNLSDYFRASILDKTAYKESEILAITIQLFISMLPLHSDRPERQDAFIANAIRLYKLLMELVK